MKMGETLGYTMIEWRTVIDQKATSAQRKSHCCSAKKPQLLCQKESWLAVTGNIFAAHKS